MSVSSVFRRISSGARSTRYLRINKFMEQGILEKTSDGVSVNVFSPFTWRIIYEDMLPEYVVLRAISVCGGVLTGMRVAGLVSPNPYSDAPVYEVYVPRERADVFASLVGLRNDILVYSSSRSLFKASLSKTIVLAYSMDKPVESEEAETRFGFPVKEAVLEQALVDVIRNDYWYYTGIAFEIYYYARKYIDPEKTLKIAKQLGVERRLYTVDYVVSETLGITQLYKIPENTVLDTPIPLPEIINELGDVID